MTEIFKLYQRVLGVIPKDASRFLVFYSLALAILSLVDSVALGLLALVITPLVTGEVLALPLVGELSGEGLLVALVVLSALIVLKSLLAVILLWYATRKFSVYEVAIGNRLFDAYIKAPWVYRLTKNSSDLVRIADSGISNSIAGFILPISTLLGEAVTFVSILIILFAVQPVVAASASLYLFVIALFLFLVLSKHSKIAAAAGFKYSLSVARLLTEMVSALKEISLSGKTNQIAGVVKIDRSKAARARANAQFLGGAPRYVLEAAVIGGFVLVGVLGYLMGGPQEAFSAISLFSLAGFRIVPSITRFQSIVTQATMTSPQVKAVIDDIQESENLQSTASDAGDSSTLGGVLTEIELQGVSFKYPAADRMALDNISLRIPLGKKVAFVGSSGAGKTSIIDLILGLIEPESGQILINGTPLNSVKNSWMSRIGYLPQEVSLFDGTVAQNVALSWGVDEIDETKVEESLRKAKLLTLVQSKLGGINSRIGERGLSLSGGQRQRLGIARALYNNPAVLVMDEGTSALDTKTESEISAEVASLSEDTSLIVVAHRLSTIQHSDVIFYMKDGRVEGQGTFDELVASFPEFAEQAVLAGLSTPTG